MRSRRPSLPPDTPWQQEMEAEFPYEETPDELAAIEVIKKIWKTTSRWTA